MTKNNRGKVQLVDGLMAFFVLVAVIVLAPFFYKFVGMVSQSADPLSAILLQLTVPLLLIALLLSVGVSARGGI